MKNDDIFLNQNKKSITQGNSFLNKGGKGKEIWVYIILGIWALINLFPVYWMFTFSLKSNEEIFGDNVAGLPKEWLWSNYEKAMGVGHIGKYFLNSTIIAIVTIAIVMLFSLMATFTLTRFIWKGRKRMNAFFMLGLTIPIHAAIVPIYVTLSKLHLLNSYLSLIIPYAAFSLAMGILICTGFMQELPMDLDEAACIDGCGVWGIFFRIIVPLMKPAVATVSIYTFLQCWNELMFANVFISDSAHKTLPVGVQALSGQYTTDWGPIGAALVLATFPTLIFYVFFSKKIQDSFIAGAIKG
ncbi:raffinose/stachyose/melibiose transport system permease protein [Anaerocolumna jejuensis DSM 15929]|uniref:Raffinose/stachyose/melibiose transport system permease protein n=1 Tax=Anaerocolumna jejuensis DSM 15929 TaxID=1121322 RepID=A0A1M6T7V5_9FIRM|nr:carbohydrate ABC transporter permease [Anaerocolumna jejuensis]SHK53033.1 raffinose/stachyose/melibiose transport system permease protein [Anaerocolumna jejuensis DSM 15929]